MSQCVVIAFGHSCDYRLQAHSIDISVRVFFPCDHMKRTRRLILKGIFNGAPSKNVHLIFAEIIELICIFAFNLFSPLQYCLASICEFGMIKIQECSYCGFNSETLLHFTGRNILW